MVRAFPGWPWHLLMAPVARNGGRGWGGEIGRAMTPLKPAAPRQLLCQAVYGRPGGQGIDSLARLLLAIAADASQPSSGSQAARGHK